MKLVVYIIVVYIFSFIVDYKILKNLGKYRINEYKYMMHRFGLKNKRKVSKSLVITSSFINALIITSVCIFNYICKWHLLIKIPISFIQLLILIYVSYGIFGVILRSKNYVKKKK